MVWYGCERFEHPGSLKQFHKFLCLCSKGHVYEMKLKIITTKINYVATHAMRTKLPCIQIQDANNGETPDTF